LGKKEIDSMLKEKIDKKQYLIKKKVNLSQPNKLVIQVMHVIRLNKFFITKIFLFNYTTIKRMILFCMKQHIF